MQSKNKSRLSWLGDLDIIVAAAVLSVLIVLTFMGVIWRYLFKAPFTWLEEVQLALYGVDCVRSCRRSLPNRQPCCH